MAFCFGIGFICIHLTPINFEENYIDKGSCFQILTFQFFLDLFSMTRIGWIFSGFAYSVNMIYFWNFFQLFDFKNKGEAILLFFILIFNYSLIAYRNEKASRAGYQTMKDTENNLRKFKEVMHGILPSPIIILDYNEKKVDFMNKSAEKMLKKLKTNEIFQIKPRNEKNMFVKKDKPEISYPSFDSFFDKVDSFIVLKHTLDNYREDSPLFSSLLRIFYDDQMLISQKIEPKNEFLTIHITDSKKKDLDAAINVTLPQKIQKHYYEVKVCTIKWENKACLLLVFNDQSKTKRLMELINLDRYKNEMLASVSHDLRTPLNGVVGMMWSALPFLRGKEGKKNLMIGIRSANLLNFLINDILDFSLMSHNKLRLNFERVDLFELVNEIISLIKTQAKKKLISVKKEFSGNGSNVLNSDSTRIKQILLNLLGNALKFTNQGGLITVKIESIYSKYKVSVIDNGIGIKPEDIPKLFVLFGRLEQENNHINRTGIGFGLTISQKLAKMLYSGEDSGIKVESEYGKGSTFSFIVESKKKDLDEILNSIEDENNNASEKIVRYNSTGSIPRNFSNSVDNSATLIANEDKNIRILIVDDDAVNIMILEQYLKYYQIEFCTAMNGLEAFKIVQTDVINGNKEISAILMDCNMPVMNGFKASEAIIDILKKNKKKEIPIIAITANVTNDDKTLCFQSGMTKFLAKPVRRKDLGLQLQQILNINLGIS